MTKVSIIIPTYNRFKYLLNAIKSIYNQTYKNIEVIIINDCSIEKEYYDFENSLKNNTIYIKKLWNNNIITNEYVMECYENDSQNKLIIINLKKNSKETLGYACAGYVRNIGMKIATGEYIAFLDDDDIWFPNKLELQIKAMQDSGCKMSCTDGLIGKGPHNLNTTYQKYNKECNFNTLQKIYKQKNSNLLDNGFPKIWTLDFLKIHNCCICSSVIIKKEILEKINYMLHVKNGQEDYDCWLRTLNHTNCIYLEDICFYYDEGHGYGQNY